MRHDDLQQRDGGGDGGEDHQQVEQQAEHGADGAHLVEHVLHGDEQQLGAADSTGGIQSETTGHNAQAGHQSHHGVHDNDEQRVLFNVFLLVQVGTVGDHGAHAQRQGEEHLTAGGGKHAEEVGNLGDVLDNGDAVDGGDHGAVHQSLGRRIVTGARHIARLEHVFQAVQRAALNGLHDGAAVGLQNGHFKLVAAQSQGAHDADNQQDEQSGHTHGADLLDAAADAAHDDEQGDEHENQAVDHGLKLVGQDAAEHVAAAQTAGAEAGADEVAEVHGDVLDAVAAQSAVEGQDQEGGQDAQPAQPLELFAQCFVSAHGAVAGLTTQSQLAHHDDKAAACCQQQINEQKGKSAAGAHFIGEAPDVTQADRRTNSGHQESKIGSEPLSFFHCFLSLILESPPRIFTLRKHIPFRGRFLPADTSKKATGYC